MQREVRAGDGMKSARIHCAAGEKAAAESGCVEKPPVGIVENACASAS